MSDATNPAQGDSPEPRFQIHKIYLKDTSFESPAAPGIFSADANPEPQINLQLNTETQRVGESLFDVTLTLTVSGEDSSRTLFLVEVKQAGLFDIAGFGDSDRARLLGTQCPAVLFPFAREVIADLVQKGGLPQLVLQPINFDAVYDQQHGQPQGASAHSAGADAQ